MPALSEYTNVYNTALELLSQKGFQLWFDEAAQLFYAEKEGWDFAGDTPLGLLGVVTIWEARQPTACKEYWWKDEGGTDYRQLPEEPKPYEPIYKRK